MVRKLVLIMDVSLDGLVARPGQFGPGDWGVRPEDPALKARKLGWLGAAGLHLMGRVTYQEMAGFWPTSDDEYAAPMNDIPKVVFSQTLAKADWAQSTIASGDLAEEISALKSEPGKDMIAWGGAAFAQSLTRLQPVALGDGLPLFAGLTAPFVLDLIEARAYADGAVLHIYRPAAR
jgi:dihydrofolate reductase